MSSTAFSLLLDFVLLAGVGAMIYYAYRLSRSLENFRKYREELGGVIQELGTHITEAQTAIEQLKETTAMSGEELDHKLKDATMLADELQLMNDAGNSLATRLETLAEQNRMIAQGFDNYEGEIGPIDTKKYDKGFSIQDRDFGTDDGDDRQTFDDYDEEPSAKSSSFKSQAEQDLYDALQAKKKQSAG